MIFNNLRYFILTIILIGFINNIHCQSTPDASQLVIKRILIKGVDILEINDSKLRYDDKLSNIILDCKRYNDIIIEWDIKQDSQFIGDTTNKYAIKLDGYDENWLILTGDKKYTRYTNLDPGFYMFKIRYSNKCLDSEDDCWDKSLTQIKMTVIPKWHQTWWARLGGIGIITAMIIII